MPPPDVSEPQLVVAVAPGREVGDVAARLAALDTPAARWLRSADGLGHPGPHVGILHYDGDGEATRQAAAADLAGLGDAVDLAESICVVGRLHAFIPGRADRTRLWYFMRRRDDFSHDRYVERYRDVHSEFGLRTPGIDAYSQLHVEPDRSEAVAADLGCGRAAFDSVSILDMPSLDHFVGAVMESPVGAEAVADEERFVDRDNSWDYVTTRL